MVVAELEAAEAAVVVVVPRAHQQHRARRSPLAVAEVLVAVPVAPEGAPQ